MEKAMTYDPYPDSGIQRELVDRISSGADFIQLHALLSQYKQRGLTAEEVAHALEQLRSSVTNESNEDRVLELLDVVHGFCSPHLKLW
jgi:anthranilate phosphoribosyltransferase